MNTAQQPPKIPIMKGGARAQVGALVAKYNTPLKVYILAILIATITFVKLIPLNIRRLADTLIGRLVLFFLTIYIADVSTVANGLLMLTLTLLLLSLSPRNVSEGFKGNGSELKMVTEDKKWFIERALKENPIGIEETDVKTQAVQDNSNSSNSNTSSR